METEAQKPPLTTAMTPDGTMFYEGCTWVRIILERPDGVMAMTEAITYPNPVMAEASFRSIINVNKRGR